MKKIILISSILLSFLFSNFAAGHVLESYGTIFDPQSSSVAPEIKKYTANLKREADGAKPFKGTFLISYCGGNYSFNEQDQTACQDLESVHIAIQTPNGNKIKIAVLGGLRSERSVILLVTNEQNGVYYFSGTHMYKYNIEKDYTITGKDFLKRKQVFDHVKIGIGHDDGSINVERGLGMPIAPLIDQKIDTPNADYYMNIRLSAFDALLEFDYRKKEEPKWIVYFFDHNGCCSLWCYKNSEFVEFQEGDAGEGTIVLRHNFTEGTFSDEPLFERRSYFDTATKTFSVDPIPDGVKVECPGPCFVGSVK